MCLPLRHELVSVFSCRIQDGAVWRWHSIFIKQTFDTPQTSTHSSSLSRWRVCQYQCFQQRQCGCHFIIIIIISSIVPVTICNPKFGKKNILSFESYLSGWMPITILVFNLFFQCLWCITTKRCITYPAKTILPPHSLCPLNNARWGLCTSKKCF